MFLPKEIQIDIQLSKFLQGKYKKFFPYEKKYWDFASTAA